MSITIDNDYKVADSVLKRLAVPVAQQECGTSDLYKAAAFSENTSKFDGQYNFGIGNFTDNTGKDSGVWALLSFMKTYYPSLYKELRTDVSLRTTTFINSWKKLATGSKKEEFMLAQVRFLWYYDGVGAIKMLKKQGHSIKLDGSRPEGFFAFLCLVHNHAPAYVVYTSKTSHGYFNAVNKALKKYPKAADSMNAISYICDVYMQTHSASWFRNGYKTNKTRCTAMTTPLYSIANEESDSSSSSSTSTHIEDIPTTTNKYTGTVSASTINVRDGAGKSNTLLGTLTKNESVTIVGIVGNWYEIEYNNGYAFVYSSYITNYKKLDTVVVVPDSTQEEQLPTQTYEQTIKGDPFIPSIAYLGTGTTALTDEVNYNDRIETTKYPSTVNYCFVDFSDTSEDEINLVKSLLIKYPNKPIFIAKTNTDIDIALEEYAKTTPNVYFIDTGIYDTPTTTDEINAYYEAIKTTISKTVIGYKQINTSEEEPSSTPDITTPQRVIISEELSPNGSRDFGEVYNLTIILPTKAVESYYTRFSFETVDEIKFSQDAKVYLEGDDVTNGQLIPTPNSKYNVLILYNPDTSKYKGMMYYGVVTKVKTGVYEDFTDSIVRNDTQKILKGYIDNYTKFTYRSKKTCVSYKNPDANKNNWVVEGSKVGDPGRYYIDCSTLCKLFLMGLSYSKSPFVKKTTNLVRDNSYSWSFNYDEIPRTSAEQAEFCVKNGYTLYGIDTDNYSNLEEGDLIFYDRDSSDNGRFMNVSHVAIVYKIENGIPYIIQASHLNVNGVWDNSINIKKVTDNTPDKIVLFARVKKY